MSTENTIRKYRSLFDGFDRQEWTLPAPVVAARDVTERVTAAKVKPPPPAQAPLDAAVEAAMEAIDPAAVDVTGILAHDRRITEHDTRIRVLRIAGERAQAELRAIIADHHDDIIVNHLRSAGRKLWNNITTAVTALGDRDPSDVSSMLRAPDRPRRAFIELDELADRYNRLREAWSRLSFRTCEHDVRGEHSEFQAGIYNIWPEGKRVAHLPAATPPWPVGDGGKGRLIWLVRAGATPWLPTTGQRDDAWKKANAEALERMKEQQLRHHQTHGQWAQTG